MCNAQAGCSVEVVQVAAGAAAVVELALQWAAEDAEQLDEKVELDGAVVGELGWVMVVMA